MLYTEAQAYPESLSFATEVSVTECASTAVVCHESGLAYTASGYISAADHTLAFVRGLTLIFDPDRTNVPFNRFVLGYTSTQPLYGTVCYTVDGAEVTDDFYLEAGTNTFSCVIGAYLEGKTASRLTSMTFDVCSKEQTTFALCVLQTELYPVYGTDAGDNGYGDTYFFENDRFRLGIRLCWGGGINYLEDKASGIDGLTNLINQHDTGRLIQQSYYGVHRNNEYEPGIFMNQEWPYNPVQGGDRGNKHSRIIDIVLCAHSVYIKSQPMNWGKIGDITPSYMENTYTLFKDAIRVDNRFVDFSGWDHLRPKDQEVPAFYSVSYLDSFVLYNGTKPWTDDALSCRDDLNFWGDGQYGKDCSFRLRRSNTETWCAWVNKETSFGVGLFVPGIGRFLAGRFQYSGNKSADHDSCCYVAPLVVKQLVPFVPLSYSYLITAGSVEEIRSVFRANKDFASNDGLLMGEINQRIADDAVVGNEYSYADCRATVSGAAAKRS